MQSEKDILFHEFENEMTNYSPNWSMIINANNVTSKTFGERLKKVRVSRGLNQDQMGERLSCLKQNISKIEHGKNKNISVERLDFISELFSVSVAYLLGLEDDDSIYIDKRQYYFWQYPNNKYEPIKKDVLSKPLIYPMETFGSPMENMVNTVMEGLKKDYDLTNFLYLIFTSEKRKQKKLRDLINAIKKIL